MNRFYRYLFLTQFISLLGGCQPELPTEVEAAYQALPKKVDYSLHVKPILSDRCFACHGNDKDNLKASLRLDLAETASAELPESPGKFAISPSNLEESQVFHRILSPHPDIQMPPPESNLQLNPEEKAILIKWIQQGAVYKPHWAFTKPQQPDIPSVGNDLKVQNPIDNFILHTLREKGLTPSKAADKALLLRRLSLDLTGLPPSEIELQEFLADSSEQAYEKQVDRLLASIHYGEKMATDWMDVARFSDTYGYQVDRYRDMSPWRDWVIEAFNKNMPYDVFITWQLAGDLLPNASREQVLATAFNRLHPQNMEDGIVDEEFRVENVSDRVAVLGDGLMGLTLSCAKCHDHKYDPISQKEYYELYSFFNNLNETGQISWDEGTPVPTLLLPTQQESQVLDSLDQQVRFQTEQLQQVEASEKEAIRSWIEQETYKQVGAKAPTHKLLAHFPLDNGSLTNRMNPKQRGEMDREFSAKEFPQFTNGHTHTGLLMNGDAWLDLKGVGVFKREDPFSIGLWVYFPKELEEGVIFHKNKGTTLHSYRGYHLYLIENKLQWVMAHTYPENAIIAYSLEEIPKEEWVHLMVTYDGSSTSEGTHLYINGQEAEMEVEKDNLYKDIIFHDLVDIIYPKPIEPNLQIGGRWRGKGIGGAIVDDIRVYARPLQALEIRQMATSVNTREFFTSSPAQLSDSQEKELASLYLHTVSQPFQEALTHLHTHRHEQVEAMENIQEIMVMEEMKEPRKTYVLNRGVYDNYGEEVFPNTPERIFPMPSGLPKNRLGLAQWLTHPDHPLTARVAVNRYWQHYFGKGLVETTQDFGNQGALPSHPELLDWLATWFIDNKWDVKALQKLMVMSYTYRQASYTSPELRELDPDNIWLARGPSIRLTSEMIRDNALAASGLLNKEVGGESVYPYQPEGLWSMNLIPTFKTREKSYIAGACTRSGDERSPIPHWRPLINRNEMYARSNVSEPIRLSKPWFC